MIRCLVSKFGRAKMAIAPPTCIKIFELKGFIIFNEVIWDNFMDLPLTMGRIVDNF